MIVDRSSWGHIAVTGTDRVRFLHGLTTVNVSGLPIGGHGWGSILSPKGRVLSVLEVTMEAERVLVHVEPALVAPTVALLEKFAVMDDVIAEVVTLDAHQRWETPALAWQAPYVFAPAPAPIASEADVEIARVEAGMLRYGVDVDDDCFPFETPLAQFLDYGKGCYVGQEPVFRVHAQGQTARQLRGLRVLDGDAPLAAGAVVVHPAKPKAGAVTSSVVSPRLGPFALAYLHRTAWAVGDEVTVDGRRATVVELPAA